MGSEDRQSATLRAPDLILRAGARARTAAELSLEAAARRTSTREELLPTGARQESREAIPPEVDSAWVASSPLQAEAGTHQAQEEQRAQAERPEGQHQGAAERRQVGRVRAEPAPAVPAPEHQEARPQGAAPREARAEARAAVAPA